MERKDRSTSAELASTALRIAVSTLSFFGEVGQAINEAEYHRYEKVSRVSGGIDLSGVDQSRLPLVSKRRIEEIIADAKTSK